MNTSEINLIFVILVEVVVIITLAVICIIKREDAKREKADRKWKSVVPRRTSIHLCFHRLRHHHLLSSLSLSPVFAVIGIIGIEKERKR